MRFEEHIKSLIETITLMMRHFARDGHPSNCKALAIRIRRLSEKCPCSDAICALHENKHIEEAITYIWGVHNISSMYSQSLALRKSGYFVRVLNAVDGFVADNLLMFRGQPPADAAAYTQEVIAYLLAQIPPDTDVLSKGGKKRRNKRKKSAYEVQAELMQYLAEVLNGCWFLNIGYLVHWCTSQHCCVNPVTGEKYCRKTCIQKVRMAMRKIIFRRMPTVPNSIKWTKLGPCADFNYGVNVVHGCFRLIYVKAFGELYVSLCEQADATDAKNAGSNLSEEYSNDINWHRVASKQVAAGLDFWSNEDKVVSIPVLCVTLEPQRFMMRYLFSAHKVARPKTSWPVVCDMTNPAHSPITIMRQAYAGLLKGSSTRLRLLFGQSGLSSAGAWLNREPERAMRFRQLVLIGDAWSKIRFEDVYLTEDAWPWRLSVCIDTRRPYVERLAVVIAFVDIHGDCLDEFCSRRLRTRLFDIWNSRCSVPLTPTDLLDWNLFTSALWTWVPRVLLAIPGVESRHARSRTRTKSSAPSFTNFSAAFVNMESLLAARVRVIHGSAVECNVVDVPALQLPSKCEKLIAYRYAFS